MGRIILVVEEHRVALTAQDVGEEAVVRLALDLDVGRTAAPSPLDAAQRMTVLGFDNREPRRTRLRIRAQHHEEVGKPGTVAPS
jgi:hypothetical protein